MATIVSGMQRVAQKIRRCPEPTLVKAIRDAAREFCRHTQWLRRELEIATEADVAQYDLITDTADAMLEIIGVRVVTIESASTRKRWINPSDPMSWNPGAEPGAPSTWTYVPESQVALWPTPDDVYTLTCTVICQPLDDTEELPDDLLRKWDQTLSAGALAYLLSLPKEDWSNPNEGLVQRRMFLAGINDARNDVSRGYNTGTVMVRIPRLF